jgi:hypothetical protein
MNILFKEFAEQAGMVKILEEHAHEYGDGTFENTPYPELEKFAELIVRECNRYARSVWEHGPLLGKDLLIHFGIEEMSDDE